MSKQKKEIFKSTLYKKISKLKIILYITSILIFILFLIINLSTLGTNPSNKEIITSIINALSIALLSLPISLSTLYNSFYQDEEKYAHIKTIITDKYDKEIIEKLNKADINVILLSESKTNFKIIKEEKITSKVLLENIQIKTDNIKLLDKKIDKTTTIKEFKNLSKLYNKIETSRGTHDNYIRTIKYLVTSNLSIIISYILLHILGFPVQYNILLVSILKLYTTIKSRYLYKTLPYDQDIMLRKVKPANIILGKQETMFLIMESFIIAFSMTIPYMYFLASGISIPTSFTLQIVIFIITNTLLPYYEINDSSYLKNIFKYIKHIKLHIFTLISIVMILILNYTKYFGTSNIRLQNNIGCLVISIFTILLLELPKLARYSTVKGRLKNESKNNKK